MLYGVISTHMGSVTVALRLLHNKKTLESGKENQSVAILRNAKHTNRTFVFTNSCNPASPDQHFSAKDAVDVTSQHAARIQSIWLQLTGRLDGKKKETLTISFQLPCDVWKANFMNHSTEHK